MDQHFYVSGTFNGDDETGCITFAAGWEHFVEEVGIAEDSVCLSSKMPEGMLPLFLILLRFLTREDKRCSLIFCLFYKSRISVARNLFYNYVML
jgi:hypothetical protein